MAEPARLSVGIDAQPVADVIEAVQQHGQRYLDRVFTPGEQEAAGWPGAPLPVLAERLAGRFAAKEAFFKALRLHTDELPGLLEVEVVSSLGGPPSLVLHGKAADAAASAQVSTLSLSTTHGAGLAVAIIVMAW